MSRRAIRQVPVSQGNACGKSSRQNARTYEDLVAAYIRVKRQKAAAEFAAYAALPNLEAAIQYAALSQDPITHKRHSHQRRIPNDVLVEAKNRLLQVDLQACHSFEQLMATVRDRIWPVRGIGDLAIYDIATRIGAYLQLEPDRIYLHRGTQDGARNLLPVRNREWVMADELPRAFAKLRPHEIEDCLCIFKDELKVIAKQNHGTKHQ